MHDLVNGSIRPADYFQGFVEKRELLNNVVPMQVATAALVFNLPAFVNLQTSTLVFSPIFIVQRPVS